MKLWVDDIRDAPNESWVTVRKVEEAINFISLYGNTLTEVSLDHDIENRPSDETFKPVAYYLALKIHLNQLEARIKGKTSLVTRVTIHSINPVGAKQIALLLEDYGIEVNIKPYEV